MGRVAPMRTLPPRSGRASPIMAPLRRIHGGSSSGTESASGTRSMGNSSSPKAVDVTTIRRSSAGAYSTSTPRPMAMGRARPWL